MPNDNVTLFRWDVFQSFNRRVLFECGAVICKSVTLRCSASPLAVGRDLSKAAEPTTL